MSEKFYTILTNIGKSKIANFAINGEEVKFVKLKVGDGNGKYYNPIENQKDLINTVWEGRIGNIQIDKDNPNWIVLEAIIPPEIGNFTIREYGAFDEEDNLLAISKCPETYKPTISNGSTKELIIKMILSVSNTESISFEVDPNIMLAKNSKVDEIDKKVNYTISQLKDIENVNGSQANVADDANLLGIPGRKTCYRSGIYTLNTPYKDNLTGGASGGYIETMLTSEPYGIQVCYVSSTSQPLKYLPSVFVRTLDRSVWSKWKPLATVDDSGWIDISSTINSKAKGSARVRRILNQTFFEIQWIGVISENETIATMPSSYAPKRQGEYVFCRFATGIITLYINGTGAIIMDYANTGTQNDKHTCFARTSYLID